MKRKLTALALSGAVLLSGCKSMLERTYSSSSPHVDYSVTAEDPSILRAESYQSLVNSVLYLVGAHQSAGTIRLYNYSGNVEADLISVRTEVLEQDPLGAYALSSLDFDSTRILTYYEIKVQISYRHTQNEIDAIHPVMGQTGLRRELERMIASTASSSVMRASYYTGDAQQVTDLFWLVFYSTPAVAFNVPQITASFFPEEGPQRILQLELSWPTNSLEYRRYSRSLSDAADARLDPEAEYDLPGLVQVLRETLVYSPSGSSTALAALTGEPANDLGSLLAMEYLCIKNGIGVSAAADNAGEEMWLIVSTPEGYRHLLPRYFIPDSTEDGSIPLLTDTELEALGYQWPTHLHPACVERPESSQ